MNSELCNKKRDHSSSALTVKAVLFDFDGTLTRPGLLDFDAIRKRMQCPSNMAILEYIDSLPSGEYRDKCVGILESFEMDAAERAEPNLDAEDTLCRLRSLGLIVGILTRNRLCSVRIALKKFNRVKARELRAIITRDDTRNPKPDPEGVLLAADRMKVSVKNMLVVGDYRFDIEAGRRAGAPTVFLDNGAVSAHHTCSDFTISRLCELKAIIAGDMPGVN